MSHQVDLVPATDIAQPLTLLEESLRDGEPIPADLAEKLRRTVEAGNMEVLVARSEDRILGVAVIAYRPNLPAGALFASVEDLYVSPHARRQGVGRALLRAVDQRCAARGISYVEVQVEDDAAEAFYATLGYGPEKGVRILSRSLAIPEASTRTRAPGTPRPP